MRKRPTSAAKPPRVSLGAEGHTGRPEIGHAVRRAQGASASEGAKASSIIILIFVLTYIVPGRFFIADLAISMDRLILLVMFFPLLIKLLSGKVGKFNSLDIFISLYAFWIGLCLIVNHGLEKIPFAGITIVEAFGGYMLGRVLIRNAADYKMFFRYFFFFLLILFPAVIFEQMTRRLIINEFFDQIFPFVYRYVDHEIRMGLNRVQATFEHPISFGLFCSIGVANYFYLYSSERMKSIAMMSFTAFMTFMSLSSAPILSMIVQFGLILWDKITNGKWIILIVFVAISYVIVDIISNRTPIEVFIQYATFNQNTAYNRIHIWNYGIQNVYMNPIFGLGLNDWERIWWLHASMDNFWLVNAVRYGIPGFLFLAVGILQMNIQVARRKNLNFEESQCRLAYLVSGVGWYFTLSTVHIWSAMFVLFMFYVGAGAWMLEAGAGPDEERASKGGGVERDRSARSSRRAAEGAPPPPPSDPAISERPNHVGPSRRSPRVTHVRPRERS